MNELELIKDYQSGMKTTEMVKKHHCSTTTITKIIDANNIPRRAKKANRHKDLNRFYLLSEPETQYWLGYICADGNVQYSVETGMYKLSLFSKDVEVIDKFVGYFGQDNVGRHTRKQNGINEVYICSKELCKYLVEELNIVPNKSLVLNPNLEYTSHFIRGYFDGDGCIRSNASTVRYEVKFTSGSKCFLDSVKATLDIEGITCRISKRKDCNAYDLLVYNKDNIALLYQYLYKDASVYLGRKHDIFVALCGKPTSDNRVNCGDDVDNPQPIQQLTELTGSTTNP